MRIGHGYDVHRLTAGRKLILGGVEIPFELGLEGHSDADVLLHAVMDALLGAAGLGDIGQHFPDTDPRYEGISSLKLLALLLPPLAKDIFKGVLAVASAAGVRAAAIAGWTGLRGILNLLIGGVDFLHLPGSFCVAGVGIGVVLFCQAAVGFFDLFVRCAPLQTQNLIGIIDHVGPSCAVPRAFFSFLLYVTQTPLYRMLSSRSLSWTRGSIS